MLKSFWARYRPHLLIILAFAILAAIYCLPVYQGKILYAHDNISWKGMAQEAKTEHLKTGDPVLWSNSMFGGMPTYTHYDTEKPKNLLVRIQNGLSTIFPRPVNFLFLAMLGFYVLALSLKMNRWAAIAGSIAYAFASYNVVIITAGHDTKMLAIAYLPMVLAGLFLIYQSKYLGGSALLAFFLGIMVAFGHYQMVYYTIIMMLFAAAGFFVIAAKAGRLRQFFAASAVVAGASVLGILPSIGGVIVTNGYSKYTMRGGESELKKEQNPGVKKSGGLDKDYAFAWSNGLGETFCFLIPDLYGSSSGQEAFQRSDEGDEMLSQTQGRVTMYWGPQSSLSGPVYFGAAICFLFVLGLMVVRSPHKWWMAALCLLATVMSWGKHLPGFNYFLFDTIPMLNKFRTVTMITVLPQLLFPALGVWALHDIASGRVDNKTLLRALYIATGITAGLALLLGPGGSLFFDYLKEGERQIPAEVREVMVSARHGLASKSGLMSTLFILLSAGLIWAFIKGKIKGQYMTIGVGIVILLDLVPVANRYLNSERYMDKDEYEATYFTPRNVDLQILKDPDPYYRVLDFSGFDGQGNAPGNFTNNSWPAYFHKNIGGYHPAKLEMYQDLIEEQISKLNIPVLAMLNTKYIIAPQGERDAAIMPPPMAPAGNAWFVSEIRWVKTATDEMRALDGPSLQDTVQQTGGFDPRKTVVLRDTYKNSVGSPALGNDSSGSVRLTKYGLNNISFQSKNAREGLAVFSDIWYPEWKAYIDGKEVPLLRANYVLRALTVPAGTHKIDFRFHPAAYYSGQTLALITSLLIIALSAFAIFRWWKKREENTEELHASVKA